MRVCILAVVSILTVVSVASCMGRPQPISKKTSHNANTNVMMAKSPIPSGWGTYIDTIHGFSVRFPPGSALNVSKSDKVLLHIDINLVPSVAGWYGLCIDVITNPEGLSAEQLYKKELAEIDKEGDWGGSDDTKYQRKVTILGQTGYERQFDLPDSTQKQITLAWDKKEYQITYMIQTADMNDKQRTNNKSRIQQLEMMISTFQRQLP
jgi:hypothetical protein